MDGQRFDEITKALATGTSRRAVLRGLAVGVTAVLTGLARGPVRPAAAGSSRECDQTALTSCYDVVHGAFRIDMIACAGDSQSRLCRGAARSQRDRGLRYCRETHCTCPAGTSKCGSDNCCGPDERCDTLVPGGGLVGLGRCVPRCTAESCGPCETCNAETGECEACDLTQCQVCVDGACVDECTVCQVCTGGVAPFCQDILCDDPCTHCDPAQGGTCVPFEVCAPGQVVDPATCSCVCQVTCPEGQQPNPETCLCECAGGTTDCYGSCVDISTDPTNCGGCGIVCTDGEQCIDGQCDDRCGTGYEICHDTFRGEVCCPDGACCPLSGGVACCRPHDGSPGGTPKCCPYPFSDYVACCTIPAGYPTDTCEFCTW